VGIGCCLRTRLQDNCLRPNETSWQA
jgi:hypothetical protein